MELKVSNLILPNSKRWNLAALNNLFEEDTINNILNIKFSQVDATNRIIWTPNSSSCHSVWSFYYLDQKEMFSTENSLLLKNFWNAKLHERHKILLWRIATGSLLWFSNEEGTCPLCETSTYNLKHLFVDCLFIVLHGGNPLGKFGIGQVMFSLEKTWFNS